MTTKLHATEIQTTRAALERLEKSDTTYISGVPKHVTLRKEKDFASSSTTYIRLYVGEECMYSKDTDFPVQALAKEITYVWDQYMTFLDSITYKQIARQGLHK